MTTAQRFQAFLSNIMLTEEQRADGILKHGGVRKCLNLHYYNSSSDTANSILVGSWGKSTQIRPPRDIDVLYVLPISVYHRYELRPGNKQSKLLQEVRGILKATYPRTRLRGDRQVVLVDFGSYSVEVVPAFPLQNGQYWVCDTKFPGRYKIFDPIAEIENVRISNNSTDGNTRNLIRIIKTWQAYCKVPISSFLIELLAIDFLRSWDYRTASVDNYDWMVRDFFPYLRSRRNGLVFVPGTAELISLGHNWGTRAITAQLRAKKACEHERKSQPYSAGEKTEGSGLHI